MKHFLITVFCSLFIAFPLFGQSYRALFIGNSYTEVNNLPQMVHDIAESMGDTLIFQSHTPGGCTFQQHVSGAAPYIQQGGWDYVVLQEQSQLPSFPISQFMNESYPYAQQLCDMIRQYNADSHIVFYMTWGRKNGDQQNAQFYPPLGTYEGMDSLLYERYMMMAQDNQAWVSPVGYVWHYMRDHYPDIELYSSDGSHPSLMGTYIAACCFYTVFFQKDPRLISFFSTLESQQAQLAREAVSLLVYDSLSKWFVTADTVPTSDSTSIQDMDIPQVQIFYHNSNHSLELSTQDHQPFTLTVTSLEGRLMRKFEGRGDDIVYFFPLDKLAANVYLVTYQTQRGKISHKIYIP